MDYNYFQNKECKYYPCHDMDDQSCLFCFCPLYYYKDCGGYCGKFNIPHYNPNGLIKNKDCSTCSLPHTPQGYTYVINFLKTRHTDNSLRY